MTHVVEVALFTDDVDAVAGFYHRLLGTGPEAEWPAGAVFAAGQTRVLVHARTPELPDGPPNEDHLALSVDDLDAACGALAADGHALLAAPRDYPWGRSAYLRDPDGRLVELAQA